MDSEWTTQPLQSDCKCSVKACGTKEYFADVEQVLKGTGLAMPFLAVRITYAMLSAFEPAKTKWNNLSGSIGVFIGMCLLMEYGAMVCFIATGLLIQRIKRTQEDLTGEAQTVWTAKRSSPNATMVSSDFAS